MGLEIERGTGSFLPQRIMLKIHVDIPIRTARSWRVVSPSKLGDTVVKGLAARMSSGVVDERLLKAARLYVDRRLPKDWLQ